MTKRRCLSVAVSSSFAFDGSVRWVLARNRGEAAAAPARPIANARKRRLRMYSRAPAMPNAAPGKASAAYRLCVVSHSVAATRMQSSTLAPSRSAIGWVRFKLQNRANDSSSANAPSGCGTDDGADLSVMPRIFLIQWIEASACSSSIPPTQPSLLPGCSVARDHAGF